MPASLFPENASEIDANPEHKTLNCTRKYYCFFVVRHVGKARRSTARPKILEYLWARQTKSNVSSRFIDFTR